MKFAARRWSNARRANQDALTLEGPTIISIV